MKKDLEKKLELTILIPCLNEEKTIGICVEKALRFIEDNYVKAEILVVDNGSTDKSSEIASSLGARVLTLSKKGYGSAIRYGIKKAQGKYIIMADADDSYNFLEILPLSLRILYFLNCKNSLTLSANSSTVKEISLSTKSST